MTDEHVHVGQFEDIYYDPIEICDIVMSTGMESLAFSSVSSCINNIHYSDIEKEIKSFLTHISYSDAVIRPFLWFVPNYIYQNIKLESMFEEIPYKGIKLHPYAHSWCFDDKRHMEMLHNIFDYASRNSIPILIHTGYNVVDNADRFEQFIGEYPLAKCILAHCRPLNVTIRLLQEYTNAYCDTAFTKKSDILKIISMGLQNKIVFGSDFPITHYFKRQYPSCLKDSLVSLREQYIEDIADWENLQKDYR